MQVSAKAKFIRTSPRKVRLVVDVVRGLKVDNAIDQLRLMNKKATGPVMKVINSAVSNAEHNFDLDKDNLFIKEIKVDEAPTLKRWMPRAHGRATTIRKRNSHIIVILGEIKDSGKKQARKVSIEAPQKLGAVASTEKAPAQKDKTTKDAKNAKDAFDDADKDKSKIKANQASTDKSKEIVDPRRQAQGGHARAEGGHKGFANKIFRRKSG